VPLPGAGLDTYRALEERVMAAEAGWTISIVPPASAPLPEVTFEDGNPDEAGLRAVETTAWAARQLRLQIGVSGRRAAEVESVVSALRSAGADARPLERTGGSALTVSWIAPGDPPAQ
jgi:hypothetical protein